MGRRAHGLGACYHCTVRVSVGQAHRELRWLLYVAVAQFLFSSVRWTFIALNSSISAYPQVERTWVCILLPMYTLCVRSCASYLAYSVIQPSLSVPDCNRIYLVGLLGGLNVIVCVMGSIWCGAMCYLMFCCIILCKVLNLLCLSFLIYKESFICFIGLLSVSLSINNHSSTS